MSGKFMSVKRYIIPTITMVIIASQLCGCAAASQSELLQMINRGDQIEIEVAVPINQEDGTETTVAWTQLDQLSSQPELRKSMDDTFKIIPQGDSKNGVLYVNLEGKQDGNNTLYNVFINSIFRNNYWNNESIQEKVAEAVAKNYTDVEFEEGHYDRAMFAAINAYFNILNDSEPGFANMDSTLSRLEAMAAIFKAEYPVTDTLTEDTDFNAAVGVDSSNEYAIFASNLSEQSFLSISSGSLDKMTAKGTITRGELVYMLVQKYFADDYNTVDTKATCFSDAKNGGDIATAQKFIEKGNEKEGWQAYELTYALQNPDQGCPERMYKALVVAYNKGIITDTDCRWDEAVTKADFLEMITNTYLALPVAISAERGTIDGYEVPAEEVTENDEISKSEINDNDTQVAEGTVDEDNVDETPAPTETPVETPVETPAETPAPTEQPSTTEQEKTDFAKSLSEEEKESYKEILGLSEEEINQLTREEFSELVYKWMHSNNSGSNSSGSSSSSNNSSSSTEASEEWPEGFDSNPQLIPDDEVIAGSM